MFQVCELGRERGKGRGTVYVTACVGCIFLSQE